MAETIVNFAIGKLLQLVSTEVDLVGSLPGEMTTISNELESIKAILKDAEKKAEDDDGMKVWLRQMRDVAYQIEDVIDDYLFLKREQNNQLQGGNSSSCFSSRRLLNKLTGSCAQLRPRHDLATAIQMIKEELGEINTRRERYQFITIDRATHQENDPSWQDICALYIGDSQLVGIEGRKAEVTRMLQEDRPVVVLLGMGGVGKTTLARKVYNQVRQGFQYYAWITVSQSYNVVDILKSVYKQFTEAAGKDSDRVPIDDSSYDLISITEKLRSYLEKPQNRYLVALDDVWEGGSLVNCIRVALPANNNGSRILITTRNTAVALSWTTIFEGHMYPLEPLSTAEAWDLFCKRVFGNRDCPDELRSIARDIIRKCDGLPLTLAAVGGLLSTKRGDCSEWRKLMNTLGSEFAINPQLQNSTRILLLSYHELPYYLKPCFLYFGMFPEDYSIDCMRLVRLWIAEGFIENRRGKTLEEVALEYLTSLVQRNLIQISRRDVTGRCRSFRVHDVLREIILSKLEESGFAQVMGKDNVLNNTHFRRLSIHYSFDTSIETCNTACNIRSVLVFGGRRMSSFLTKTQKKLFRFLRVLDLQDAFIYAIPEEVGDLHNLHLLSLRNTNVKTLPNSIGHLLNLQTLDFKHSRVTKIPDQLKSLHRLRHLLGYYYGSTNRYPFLTEATEIPLGVLENFRELQKLAFIDGSESGLLIELRNLKQLTKLGIRGLTEDNGVILCQAIEEMQDLRSVSICSTRHNELLNIQTLKQPPCFLERLYLTGNLEKLPDWISSLANLTKLALKCSQLDNDPVEKLQGLANLVELLLYEAYRGEKLDFGINGFQKLQVLRLSKLANLRTIQGALPVLHNLQHRCCPQLVEAPPHIKLYVSRSFGYAARRGSSSY